MKTVEQQPAYILHKIDLQENKYLLDIFTLSFGRMTVSIYIKKNKALLQSFQPLLLSWRHYPKSTIIQTIEALPKKWHVSGKQIVIAFYLNELIRYLLPIEHAYPRLFSLYGETLATLDKAIEPLLRSFEKILLEEIGYGLNLREDQDHQPIIAQDWYVWDILHGARKKTSLDEVGIFIQGQTLLNLYYQKDWDTETLKQAKQLMRIIINYLLPDKKFYSRELFYTYLKGV